MKIKQTILGNRSIAEIESPNILIKSEQDALDLMAETDSEYLVLHDYNFTPDFFDLSTKKLGEVLQKFTNYRIKLAIIGDFDRYPSHVLKDFIYESNRHGDYLFLNKIAEIYLIWGR